MLCTRFLALLYRSWLNTVRSCSIRSAESGVAGREYRQLPRFHCPIAAGLVCVVGSCLALLTEKYGVTFCGLRGPRPDGLWPTNRNNVSSMAAIGNELCVVDHDHGQVVRRGLDRNATEAFYGKWLRQHSKEFNVPTEIAVANGHVYVLDPPFVHVFSVDGTFVRRFGQDRVIACHGIAVSSVGEVFVASNTESVIEVRQHLCFR